MRHLKQTFLEFLKDNFTKIFLVSFIMHGLAYNKCVSYKLENFNSA